MEKSLEQTEPSDLTANECEQRAINRLTNYEMLSVEEKLNALRDVRDLLRIADKKRWQEGFPRPEGEFSMLPDLAQGPSLDGG